MLSTRTKISLCEYLELQEIPVLLLLLEKFDMESRFSPTQKVEDLRNSIFDATTEQLLNLLDEIFRTSEDLRFRISPKYRHQVRWENLIRSLQLDGYKADKQNLIRIEPIIENVEPVEDDFTKELKRSALAEVDIIITMIEKSAEAFRQTPPDYNDCLVKARIGLETLTKMIVKGWQSQHPDNFNEDKWGEILAYLRKSDFITKKEEEGLSGVYTFVSPGAHAPIVNSGDEEMTRLGRNLVISMCYFLVKRYNLMCRL